MSGIYWWDLMKMDANDAKERDSGQRPLSDYESSAQSAAEALLSAMQRGKKEVAFDKWGKVKPRDVPGATAYGLEYGNFQVVLEGSVNLFSEGAGVTMTIRDKKGRETGFFRGATKGPIADLGKRVFDGVTTPDKDGVAASLRELGS